VPRYRVQFRTEAGLPDEARGALHAAGIELVSGHGGVSHSEPGGRWRERPSPSSYSAFEPLKSA
jgi:hypothetical protein